MPQEAIQYKHPSKEIGDKNNYCTMRLNELLLKIPEQK
jgi:hypothetical protein